MGNAYNNASLLVTPNGYKASKIYSAKPTDGSGDLAFSRASNSTLLNSAGLIEVVGNNIPRLNYPNLGGCPSWLFEPQATNLNTYSEDLSNANWVKSSVTVVSNNTNSPSGTLTADLVYPSVGGLSFIFQTSLVVIGETYTSSFFVKASGKNFCWLLDVNGSVGPKFDLINGTVLTNPNGNAKITQFQNGWYKISDTKIATAIAGYVGVSSCDSAITNDSTPNGTDGVSAWGGGLELGSVATSYIPTVASAVTRLADAVSKTGISSLIGQTEGTIFIDYTFLGIGDPITNFSNIFNTNKNVDSAIIIQRSASNGSINGAIIAGATVFNFAGGNSVINTKTKIAFVYQSGNNSLFVNGVKVATNTISFAFTQALSEINLNDPTTYFGYQGIEEFDEVLLYKTALSDSEAIELTTL
jgi:hypothetical protein